MAPVTVSVPATSANLGSGYDSFGLALGLRNEITVALSADGSWDVQVSGEGEHDATLARDNRVVTALLRIFTEVGRPDTGATLVCHNEIPIGRGLGSSSAAIIAGLVAGNELVGRPFSTQELFALAADIEGHPDNVAAALVGGFTLCWRDDDWHFARLEPAGGLAAVCVVSDNRLATAKARELLPPTVPHRDAAFNVGRAGLLTAGIALGRRELIRAGMADRLHERYRSVAVPDLEDVGDALVAAGADGAALSGSGPTVIGLVSGTDDGDALARAVAVAHRAAGMLAGRSGRQAPMVLPVDRHGPRVIA